MKALALREIPLDLDGIPSLPIFVQQLLIALQDEDSRAQDLVRIIRQDPAMSSRLLRVANSSFFGRSGRVGTLDRAIVLLGGRFIQALALSICLIDTVVYKKTEGQVPWEAYWIHSFACAVACHRLVQLKAVEGIQDEAFLSGLLHDIGKPILWIFQAKPYQQVVKKIQEEGHETHHVEKELLGVHHGEVGGAVAEWWKLPRGIQEAVRNHHGGDIALPSANLVQVGDHVAYRAGFSDGLQCVDSKLSIAFGASIRGSNGIVDGLVQELRERPQEIQEMVDLLCGARG
jgi:HD-like signal output (HDOD) protein